MVIILIREQWKGGLAIYMKLKKISQLCNKQKNYIIYDKPVPAGGITQWLGDGSAAYPLEGLPLLDEDNLCRMFDISEDHRNKMLIQRIVIPDGICMDDIDPGESEARKMELGIARRGREFIPLMTHAGITFIQKKYLAPLNGEESTLEFYERKTSRGQTYIAVKTGLLIRAVIFPVEFVDDRFVNQLGDMLRECRSLLERTKNRIGDEIFQLTWTEQDEEDTP